MTARLFAVALCLCSARMSHAAIMVTFDSTSVTANQTGFVDVWIESSDGSDSLAGFDAYFRLSGPTTNGNLAFAPTLSQPNSQSLPDYVFFGHPDLDPLNYSATRLSATEIQLRDFLNNINQTALGTTRWLLARFAVVHTTATPALADGDTYTIQMHAQSSDALNDTVFFDSVNDLTINSFAETGSIRVTSAPAAAVPEPTVGFISGLAVCLFAMRRRNRASSKQKSTSIHLNS